MKKKKSIKISIMQPINKINKMFKCSLLTQCFINIKLVGCRKHTGIFIFKVTQKFINLKNINKMTGIKKNNPLKLFLKISQVGYFLLILTFQFLKTGLISLIINIRSVTIFVGVSYSKKGFPWCSW